MSVAEYINKMKMLGEEMVAAGMSLEDAELIEYVLTGLNQDYDPIIFAVIARSDPVSLSELYSQLLAFETRCALMSAYEGSGSSVNAASRGRGRNSHCGFGRGYGHDSSIGGGRGCFNSANGRHGGFNSSTDKRPICQVCTKKGHITKEKVAAAASGAQGTDNNWYTDSGATDHITLDLEKLAVHDKYLSTDQINTASGAGMHISHIGKSTIHTPCRQLQLNKILHVPQASKNLIFVHRLASDNNVFLEFHLHFFVIKDLDLRNTLLKGPCQGGLYPLPASSLEKQAFGVNKVACGVIKPSVERWHRRLGHLALSIVQRVIRDFLLPCLPQ
jgi:hypothetical protein